MGLTHWMSRTGAALRSGWTIGFVLLAIAVATDSALVSAPAGYGYRPPDSHWHACLSDAGAFSRALRQTSASQALQEDLQPLYADAALAVRRQTGIRPNALRWRVWMGKRLLVARSPAGAGLCVYPGALLRLTAGLHAAFTSSDAQGVHRFSEWRYAWRDGYLIASRKEAYVRDTLAAGVFETGTGTNAGDAEAQGVSMDPRTLDVAWEAPVRGGVRITAAESLPVTGFSHVPITRRATPLTLSARTSQPQCLTVAATTWTDVASIAERLVDVCAPSGAATIVRECVRQAIRDWRLTMPDAGWQAPLQQTAVALRTVRAAGETPVPELTAALACLPSSVDEHPLFPIAAGLSRTPFEWTGTPGTASPILGDDLNLCLAGRDGLWLAATTEPAMAELAAGPHASDPVYADAVVEADWEAIAQTLETWLPLLADWEAFAERNREDVEADWMPLVRAASELGRARLLIEQNNGVAAFEGELARPAPKSEAPG